MLRMSKTIDDPKKAVADGDMPYVTACLSGDTEAFAVLVERHSGKMLNIACRMLGDYDEACDVTQEAFLAAFRSLKLFKADAKFSTWLYRIVLNTAKNRLKVRRSLMHREGTSLDVVDGTEGCAVCLAASDSSDPERQLERRDVEMHVQKCMDALESDYREVLVLRDIQGLAYEEIRDVLGIPDGTVKSRISRARLAMKDCLKKVIGDL